MFSCPLLLMKFRDVKFLISFGKHLKSVRELQGYTQEQLAYESGLSLSQIARIETGKINPTICTVDVISKTLSVDRKTLLDF